MLLVFPLIFLISFLVSLKELFSWKKQGLLIFFIFGLPIYTTTLSVLFEYGFKGQIGIFQSFKELIALTALVIFYLQSRPILKLRTIDWLLIIYFSYSFLYVLLPVGVHSIAEKLLAFKSSCFFIVPYSLGRLIKPSEIYINKYLTYMLFVAIAAAALCAFEVITYQHFQTYTGYADFNYYIFNLEPSGNYGLTWTFEIENGVKRFASFFANPLEFAAASVMSLAAIAALYTRRDYSFKPNLLGLLAIASVLLSISFALSRASFVGFLLVIYIYAFITFKRHITRFMNACLVIAIIYLTFLISRQDQFFKEFIVNTFTFSNTSSVGHILAWLEGINALIQAPLGLGLGESGRIAGTIGESIGGENQFIIIGVQTGIITLIIYLLTYILFISKSYTWYYKLQGKDKKVCLFILLIKIGFFIPLFTSELESSVFVSYVSWFFSGLLINIISLRQISLKNEKAT